LFKRFTGLSPHSYLVQIKIQNAQRLLQKEKDIASVAYDTGFTDQAHFTRWFKKIMGVTPGRFMVRQGIKGKR
jgi:AraC-like DNA-binding protein